MSKIDMEDSELVLLIQLLNQRIVSEQREQRETPAETRLIKKLLAARTEGIVASRK